MGSPRGRSRRPVRRRRRPPPPQTEWWHVVTAIVITLVALVSWASVIRDRGADDDAREPEVAAGREGDAPPRSFSIAAAGDVLLHEPVYARAAANAGSDGYEFDPMFEPIRPIVEAADLAICHVETPISDDNADVSSFPIFNAPREIANDLVDAGFDLCSTASNHSFDKGVEGVITTLKVLRRAGLRTEGTAKSAREARAPELLDVNGVRVGHLSYTYGLNGFVLPEDQEYLVNVIRPKRILREAERARDRGAEFVVVSLHWGQEFQTEPTPDQLKLARKLLRSPRIDLVLGHHTHVPQPVKRIGKEFVIFGMGNMISNQHPGATPTCCPSETQDGLVVSVEIDEAGSGWRTRVRYSPTWVRPGTFEVLPVATALKDPRLADLRSQLEDSWARTVATVNSMGARRAGVRPAEIP